MVRINTTTMAFFIPYFLPLISYYQ